MYWHSVWVECIDFEAWVAGFVFGYFYRTWDKQPKRYCEFTIVHLGIEGRPYPVALYSRVGIDGTIVFRWVDRVDAYWYNDFWIWFFGKEEEGSHIRVICSSQGQVDISSFSSIIDDSDIIFCCKCAVDRNVWFVVVEMGVVLGCHLDMVVDGIGTDDLSLCRNGAVSSHFDQ